MSFTCWVEGQQIKIYFLEVDLRSYLTEKKILKWETSLACNSKIEVYICLTRECPQFGKRVRNTVSFGD